MPYTVLLGDPRAVGTGNPPADVNNLNDVVQGMGGYFNIWNTAFSGGADPTGAADSTNALNAALAAAAAAGTVPSVPPGSYTIGGELTPTANAACGLAGAGVQATYLNFTTATAALAFTGWTGFQRFSLTGMTITQNGAGDLIQIGSSSADRLPQFTCYDVAFILGSSNTAGSLINAQAPANSNGLASSLFTRCTFTTQSTTRTVPALNLTCQVAGGMSNVTWDKCDFNASDNEVYLVYLSTTAGASDNGYHEGMVFRDPRFESPNGGAIQSMSGRGLKIINSTIWDIGLNGGPTLGNSLIYIGSNSGQYVSTGTEIRGYTRYNGSASSGLTPNGTSEWDIYIDASSAQTHIDSPATIAYYHTHPDPISINCNGCPSVTITNPQSSAAADPASILITNPPVQLTYPALAPAVSQWMPSDMGYAAESFDIVFGANSNTRLITNGKLNFIGIQLRQYWTASGVDLFQIANGATLTSGECLIGLYSSAGVLLGYSADQSTAWASGEPDKVPAALTAQSAGSLTLTPGFYWIALLGNGTTMPSFLNQGTNLAASQINGRLAVASSRYALSNSTYTALPASFTPSGSFMTASQIAWWAGIY